LRADSPASWSDEDPAAAVEREESEEGRDRFAMGGQAGREGIDPFERRATRIEEGQTLFAPWGDLEKFSWALRTKPTRL
jgi:hypothetical protein